MLDPLRMSAEVCRYATSRASSERRNTFGRDQRLKIIILLLLFQVKPGRCPTRMFQVSEQATCKLDCCWHAVATMFPNSKRRQEIMLSLKKCSEGAACVGIRTLHSARVLLEVAHGTAAPPPSNSEQVAPFHTAHIKLLAPVMVVRTQKCRISLWNLYLAN